MNFEITGTIIDVLSAQTFNKGFKKREFVVETNEKYSQKIVFQLVQDKCEMIDSFGIGDTVTVAFNVKGRDWVDNSGTTKYFNTLEAWRISGNSRAPITNNGIEDEDEDDFMNDLDLFPEKKQKKQVPPTTDIDLDDDFPFN